MLRVLQKINASGRESVCLGDRRGLEYELKLSRTTASGATLPHTRILLRVTRGRLSRVGESAQGHFAGRSPLPRTSVLRSGLLGS